MPFMNYRSADREMRLVLEERHGPVDRIDDEDGFRLKARRVVVRFLRQPSIGRPRGAQTLFQETIDRKVRLRHRASLGFAPAFVAATEKAARDLSRFPH